MHHDQLTRRALEMLRGNDDYIADAREGVRVNNSVVGSLLSLQYQVPRQHAEQAVADALDTLDSSAAESVETDGGGNYTLRRSGRPPLRFQGVLLAEADGQRQYGKEQNRWHELAVYRTRGGKYVVRIAYRTRWQYEGDYDETEVCERAEQVAVILRDYDPVAHVQGFPASDVYGEKQARLLADIRDRYDALVSDVLADEVFTEEIE